MIDEGRRFFTPLLRKTLRMVDVIIEHIVRLTDCIMAKKDLITCDGCIPEEVAKILLQSVFTNNTKHQSHLFYDKILEVVVFVV